MRKLFIINFMNTSVINFFPVDQISQGIQLSTQSFSYDREIQGINEGIAFGALLTDLSKSSDCIGHTLLMTKLSAFGVSHLLLKLIYSYSSNGIQQIKISDNSSDKTDTEFGVTQGFVLEPLLFNIDMIDVFTNSKILMLQVMLMTQHRVHV